MSGISLGCFIGCWLNLCFQIDGVIFLSFRCHYGWNFKRDTSFHLHKVCSCSFHVLIMKSSSRRFLPGLFKNIPISKLGQEILRKSVACNGFKCESCAREIERLFLNFVQARRKLSCCRRYFRQCHHCEAHSERVFFQVLCSNSRGIVKISSYFVHQCIS